MLGAERLVPGLSSEVIARLIIQVPYCIGQMRGGASRKFGTAYIGSECR